MSVGQVLLTGDYWHEDFKECIRHFDVPVMMVPISQLQSTLTREPKFSVMVIAQSRRGQLDESMVDAIRQSHPNTPLVSLLGSWCEGEERSGSPAAGVIRVYWHQWKGRYDEFCQSLERKGITDWHLPATASPADRALIADTVDGSNGGQTPVQKASGRVAISTWTQDQFDMLSDAVQQMGKQSFWVEHETWDAKRPPAVASVLVDGNSMTATLAERIVGLRKTFGGIPMVLTLNFPRVDESVWADELKVAEIVSKPFQLADLKQALDRSAASHDKTQSKSTTL